MSECVEMARRLGQKVGSELNIPVYLYEAAALRPERTNLEVIRKGQYEGLKVDVQTNPERKPDFGPANLGAAGATVIGARAPLVAFNVYLTTSDVSIAKTIARAVRQSSGGFRFVKAAGFLVEGRAQVSMNLTDYRQTPLARVIETIRREALRYGVGIHHSELVGLIPQEALLDAAVWYTQLDQFSPEQVLETRLAAASTAQEAGGLEEDGTIPVRFTKQIDSDSGRAVFLDALSAAIPAPGGGSAAAYAGAMGAGLVSMVAGLTIGRKKYVAEEDRMKTILVESEQLRAELNAAVAQDAAAFEDVMAAFRLPRDTPEQARQRADKIENATLNAARVPLSVTRKALRVMELGAIVTASGNLNAISDGASGAALARAALTAAGTNVRINVNSLVDKASGSLLLAELKKIETQALTLESEIRKSLETRAGFIF